MILLKRFVVPVLFAAVLGSAGPTAAQQSFQPSTKFLETEFVRGNAWGGEHRFENVFCLTIPRPSDVKSLTVAMYNSNALYYSKAMYRDIDTTGLFVVTSTVPVGRSVETEIGNMEALNQENAAAYPDNFKQGRMTGPLGPSLLLTIRNATAGSKDRPFPFVRHVANHADGQLRTLSVHRLFVRGSDRIEVAGLRYFSTPIGMDGEGDAVAKLSALVESAADSLQSCSANLPPRAQ